jgi:hypothetical protein
MPSDVTILLSFFMAMSTPILSTPNTPSPCARARVESQSARVLTVERVHIFGFSRGCAGGAFRDEEELRVRVKSE